MSLGLFEQFISGLEKLDLYKELYKKDEKFTNQKEEQFTKLINALKSDLENGKLPNQSKLAEKMVTMVTLFPDIITDQNNHLLENVYQRVRPNDFILPDAIREMLSQPTEHPHPSFTKK